MAIVLTVDEIREYVSDYAPNNYLIDGEEFTDTFITLSMNLAIDAFNNITPRTKSTLNTFPSKVILLYGTVWQMYLGKALLLARNTMNYSDGGLQIPVEERAQLYQGLAQQFQAQFQDAAQKLKIQMNMECGWGGISSDEAYFPSW
jgi:hypothetical protein